jgi:hypothetical protein
MLNRMASSDTALQACIKVLFFQVVLEKKGLLYGLKLKRIWV